MSTEGPDPCELLTWDTGFFGFRIARVLGNRLTRRAAKEIDLWCQEREIGCLYFLADADDPDTAKAAEENSFRLVDVRITFVHRVASVGLVPDSLVRTAVVRPACPKDMPMLQTIARDSHFDTRFFQDVNFPRHLSQALYETWIRVSCEGYADQVLVAEHESIPTGYVTCHVDRSERVGRIGLLAVSRRDRGLGLGFELVRNALEWFAIQGMQQVRVVTQETNHAAQRLYERCEFSARGRELWYHKWYKLKESTSA